MSLETVNLTIQNAFRMPVQNVLVHVYDSLNAEVADGTTDIDGLFTTSLNGAVSPGITYRVILNKTGAACGNSHPIQVVS